MESISTHDDCFIELSEFICANQGDIKDNPQLINKYIPYLLNLADQGLWGKLSIIGVRLFTCEYKCPQKNYAYLFDPLPLLNSFFSNGKGYISIQNIYDIENVYKSIPILLIWCFNEKNSKNLINLAKKIPPFTLTGCDKVIKQIIEPKLLSSITKSPDDLPGFQSLIKIVYKNLTVHNNTQKLIIGTELGTLTLDFIFKVFEEECNPYHLGLMITDNILPPIPNFSDIPVNCIQEESYIHEMRIPEVKEEKPKKNKSHHKVS